MLKWTGSSAPAGDPPGGAGARSPQRASAADRPAGMGKGWIPAEGRLDLEKEGRTEWPAAEIAAAGPANIRLTALPPEIGRLAALHTLDVSGNQLAALPPEIGRLAALHADGNPFTAMPELLKKKNTAERLAYLRSLPAPAPAPAPAARPAAPAAPRPAAPAAPRPSAAPAPSTPGQCTPPVLPFPRREPVPSGPRPSASPPRPRAGSARPASAARDPRGMRVADVCEWLRSLDLGKLAPAFEGCAVDGKMLLELTEGDLREELGVESGLVRRRVLKEIADLASEHGLSSAAPNAPRARPQSAAARRAPPLPPGYKFHAFITYRRLDGRNHLASFVREALDKTGYKTFFDLQTLQGGVFDSKILESLRASCCDVFVLTPGTLDRCFEDKAPSAALSTDWVRKELAEGTRLRKAIIPFVDDPNEKFPACDGLPADMAAFSRHNAVFFSNMYQQAAIARLCALIDAAVADAAPYESLPPPLA
eukprot:tig00000532_g1884.t1